MQPEPFIAAGRGGFFDGVTKALRKLYDPVTRERIPDDLSDFLKKL